MENYIQSLPSGYHIEGTAVEGAAPPGRPLTVHMVPSSSVRLVATPEEAAAAHSPPAQPPSPHGWPASSAFAVAPADTFSELVTNLISPYLVDSDGVLLTSAESTPEWGAAGDSEVGAADAGASQPPPAGGAGSRPADSALLERKSQLSTPLSDDARLTKLGWDKQTVFRLLTQLIKRGRSLVYS